MQPEIKILEQKRCLGLSLEMSIADNKTSELWKTFVPKIQTVSNRVSNDKISLQVYPSDYFSQFSPNTTFKKWALVEVKDFKNTPADLKSFIIPSGQYAVFHYKGSSEDTSIFQYIYGEWLAKSKYKLDNRPHFEVLGNRYRNNDPNSEEEIWIPIA